MSFRKKVLILFSATVALLGAYYLVSSSVSLMCEEGIETIECVYKNPKVLTTNEYQEHPVVEAALERIFDNACNEVKFAALTLAVGMRLNGNAHLTEHVFEAFDHLILNYSECLLQVMLSMNREERQDAIRILEYISSDNGYKSEGIRSLEKFKGQKVFHDVFN